MQNLLKRVLIQWFDHKVVKATLYGYVMVLGRIVSRATKVNRLDLSRQTILNHGAQLFNEFKSVHVWHAVVDKHDFVHLCYALCHQFDPLLDQIDCLRTYQSGVTADSYI